MDLMTLAAKLTLDAGDYEKGIKKAEGNFSKFGKTLSAKTVALGTFAGNMLTKATTASFKAISNVIKSSTDAYAKFEQLTGGVKTLFGTKEINNAKDYAKQIGLITTKTDKAGKTIEQVNKKMAKSLFGDKTGKATKGMTVEEASQKAFEQAQEAEKTVMDNASKAYKTAGVSMNQYMDTATSLAASMNQSTGGDVLKSAELTDMAIRDMADNANKMGTDMSSVENAYKGFAKGNYTMLDNLKLGYGGTKGEMARLLKDASAITGEKYKMGNMADMVKAINAIQKQQGITGTTEEEAKKTIEGSKKMLSASWENVLTALASPEDLDLSGAIASLTDSAKTYLNNLFPVVSEVLSGLGDMMEQILPDIMEKLPELLADFVPKLVKAGEKMLQGLGKGLKKVAAKIKLPEWKDVKATAIKAWDTIKNGAKELGGLIFGKNPDGSIKWPTWNDVKKKAEEAWETIKTGASELGGLIFGKNPDGTIKWPTWDDVKAKAEEAWETIKAGALELGGLVFGKTEEGEVAWPDITKLVEDFSKWWTETAIPALTGVMTWTLTLFGMPQESAEQISSLIGGWWDTMVSTAESVLKWVLNLPDTPYEAGEQLGEIIGKWWQGLVSYAEGALQWVLGLFDIGDADGKGTLEMIQGWWDNTVVPLLTGALNFILGLFGLPPAEDMVKSITDWWEGIKKSIKDLLTIDVKAIWNPDKNENGGLSSEEGDVLKSQYNFLDEQDMDKTPFFNSLEGKMAGAGFTQGAIDTAKGAIGEHDGDVDWVENFLTQLEDASSAVEALANEGFNGEVFEELGEAGEESGEKLEKSMDDTAEATSDAAAEVDALNEKITGLPDKKNIDVTVTPHIGGLLGWFANLFPHAKGLPTVPYDNYLASLHRGEMVLTKSQARQYREGNTGNFDPTAMAASIVAAVRDGMAGAQVNSFIDGKPTTDNVNRRTSNKLRARRFATV